MYFEVSRHSYSFMLKRKYACVTGGVPPSRWVVNFDFDLLDGLVLAAVLAAHAPFLVIVCISVYMPTVSFENVKNYNKILKPGSCVKIMTLQCSYTSLTCCFFIVTSAMISVM